MPDFQAVHADLGNKVAFVGVNVTGVLGETRRAAEVFARKTGVRYPVIFDQGGLLYYHFSPRPLLPVTVFVDAAGIVKERHIGQMTGKELRAAIGHFLNA